MIIFRSLFKLKCVCCFICLVLAVPVFAQEYVVTRPKIALVLGGGGARGAAHVGVLKVLEEQRVPVDYIVGTSMGALVAGLYVSGISPEEMETLFNEIDWDSLFKDKPTDDYLPFRLKGDEQRFMVLETGIKQGKIVLPRGFIAGQKLSFFLKKMTLPVSDIENFDQLPIPYRAVAADIGTGDAFIFDHGNIAEAMRASMTIPGVFSPVEIDGHVLVDGGVVNNVPIDVARDMGADIIIVVEVGPVLENTEKLKSAVAIMMQSLDILGKGDVQRKLALLSEDDILIQPDVGSIETGSFYQAPEAVITGEKAARKAENSFSKFGVSAKEYEAYLTRLRPEKKDPITIDFIEVANPEKLRPEIIKGRLSVKTGEELDLKRLQKDLTRVYAMGDFEKVEFDVVRRDSQRGLYIKTKEKEWGPDYLRFGLNLNSDSTGDSEYTALADYRMTQINSLGGEWRNIFQFGATTGLFSEFHQPLDVYNRFFIAPNFRIERYLSDVYENDDRVAEYRVDYHGAGVNLGVNVSSYTQFKMGLTRGSIEANSGIGGVALPEFNSIQEGAFTAKLIYDQLDSHIFPSRGIQSQLALYLSDKKLGADFNYEKLKFDLMKARTYYRKHTFVAGCEAGMSVDEDTPFYDQFTLGGFLSLSGYEENQLRAQHSGLGRLIYFYTLGDDASGVARNIHLGAALEYGNVWDDFDDIAFNDSRLSGTVFVGMKTMLGPLYFGYGLAEGYSDGRLYLFLGQTFY
ncbi:MAG: BamA/TamA family outer membrane protein [PVC group bacterium]|nr:BamA/TamA family outer membrane protein [PVC group bacterium]